MMYDLLDDGTTDTTVLYHGMICERYPLSQKHQHLYVAFERFRWYTDSTLFLLAFAAINWSAYNRIWLASFAGP